MARLGVVRSGRGGAEALLIRGDAGSRSTLWHSGIAVAKECDYRLST